MFNQMLKRSIALLCALCSLLVLIPGTSSFAAGSSILSEKMILDLEAFEILSGMEDGELHLEQQITRAQFCRVVATVMGNEGGVYSDREYSDVPQTHWAYPYIQTLSGLGLLNGYSDGSFRPDDPVKYEDAVKILVVMLGYGIEAERMGGYPDGYIGVGSRVSLMQGVGAAIGAQLTREQAMRMIYNSLDAKRMIQSITGSSDVELKAAEETYRDILLGDDEDGLKKVEGIITATREFYLGEANPDMDDNLIEIDGVVYHSADPGMSRYFGMAVSAYIKANPNGAYDIVKRFSPDKDNKELVLDIADVSELTNDKIVYENDKGRTEDERMAIDVQFLYNGRQIAGNDVSLLDIDNMHDATVRCIGNTEKNEFNVVMIDEYESFLVDRTVGTEKRIYLAQNQRFNNYRYIDANDEDDNRVVTIRNAQGELCNVADISEGDIVTVIASDDSNLVRIYYSSNETEGVIKSIDSQYKEISVDGELYRYERNVDTEDVLGKMVLVKFNYLGGVAYIDEDGMEHDGDGYGAIVGYGRNEEEDNVRLRFLVPGKIKDDVEESDSDDPNSNDIPAIAAQNEAVLSMFTAQEITFDREKYGTEDFETELGRRLLGRRYLAVSYTLDDDGKIKRLDTLEIMPVVPEAYYMDGTVRTVIEGEKKYNAYEKTFGGMANGSFGLDESTLGVCVPTNSVSSLNDYLARIEMNNAQEYDVAAYKYNKDTHCPELVVFNAEMHGDTNGEINDKSKIALVREAYDTLDEYEDRIKGVVMMTEDGIKTVQFSDETASSADFSTLKTGDLIYYSLDAQDRMDGFEHIITVAPIPGDMHDADIAKEIYVGNIIDAEYNHVSDTLNRWVDTLVISAQGVNEVSYQIPTKTGVPPIYVYDTSKAKEERIAIGTSDDFLSEQEKAVVVSRNNRVKAVVIIK